MAYDEKLADRIRQVLAKEQNLGERKMFGGISFMLGGNMCCGVVKDLLMARIGPESYEGALCPTNDIHWPSIQRLRVC